jgi:hypothetical protein
MGIINSIEEDEEERTEDLEAGQTDVNIINYAENNQRVFLDFF